VGSVITLDDAAAMALALPEVTEGTRWLTRTWSVNGKTFAWERPLSKADRKRYGAAPMPEGDLLAVQVGDLGEKEAILAAGHKGFFTITHFDNYPAVLIELRLAGKKAVREVLVDGWLECAPAQLARDFLDVLRATD
jgi:hypothetical protein